MSKAYRIIIVAVLVVAVGAVITVKNREAPAQPVAQVSSQSAPSAEQRLPRLVDLGAGKCMNCKMMIPVLAELRTNYVEIFDVEFVDVWENPEAAQKYRIRIIPTQIFYAGDGKELFRHEGFFGREEILAKWKEFGVIASSDTRD